MRTVTMPFAAQVNLSEENTVIEMSGEINIDADAGLAQAFDEAQASGPKAITLDFGNVDYINSTGIALIVGLLAKARAAHIALRAEGLTDHYREIFTITRLSDFIEIN